MPRPRKVAIPQEEPKEVTGKAQKKEKAAPSKAKNAKLNPPNAAKKVKIDYEQAFSHDGKNLAQIILGLQRNSSNVSKSVTDLKKVYEKVRESSVFFDFNRIIFQLDLQMEHSAFFDIFKKVMLAFLILPETQSDNANKILKFIGSFVASYGDVTQPNGDTHPLITNIFDEILAVRRT